MRGIGRGRKIAGPLKWKLLFDRKAIFVKKLDDPPEIALTFVNKNNIINLVTSVAFVQRARLIFLSAQKEEMILFLREGQIS